MASGIRMIPARSAIRPMGMAGSVGTTSPTGQPARRIPRAIRVSARSLRPVRAANASPNRRLMAAPVATTWSAVAEPAAASGNAAAKAARATAGLRLLYRGSPVEALSTRRCGGETRTPAETGLSGGRGYPYFPAVCEPCRKHPSAWRREWPAEQVRAVVDRPGAEGARLEVVRRLGWSALPSNAYSVEVEAGEARFEGRGEGHGIVGVMNDVTELKRLQDELVTARQAADAANAARRVQPFPSPPDIFTNNCCPAGMPSASVQFWRSIRACSSPVT